MEPYFSQEGLRRTVERLAASPADQRDYLQRLGTLPSLDELALELDDELQRARGLGTHRGSASLEELEAHLTAMSSPANADLWRHEALDREEWARVRALAAAVLRELDSETRGTRVR
ncbi:MAG: hypothetical protein M3071_15150 [Actinomycetota bacterium]|nr:hypothetical protein [Actinomycetota bacterium]